MKVRSLAFLMWMALGHLVFGVSLDEQITPQNLEGQPFKFSIVAETHDGLVTFHVSVAAKNVSQSLLALDPLLVLMNGEKKLVAVTLVEAKKKSDRLEVREFQVSAGYLENSEFEFRTEGAVFFFHLKDFVKD